MKPSQVFPITFDPVLHATQVTGINLSKLTNDVATHKIRAKKNPPKRVLKLTTGLIILSAF